MLDFSVFFICNAFYQALLSCSRQLYCTVHCLRWHQQSDDDDDDDDDDDEDHLAICILHSEWISLCAYNWRVNSPLLCLLYLSTDNRYWLTCVGCPYQCSSCTLSASLIPTCSTCNSDFTLASVDSTCFRTFSLSSHNKMLSTDRQM